MINNIMDNEDKQSENNKIDIKWIRNIGAALVSEVSFELNGISLQKWKTHKCKKCNEYHTIYVFSREK